MAPFPAKGQRRHQAQADGRRCHLRTAWAQWQQAASAWQNGRAFPYSEGVGDGPAVLAC